MACQIGHDLAEPLAGKLEPVARVDGQPAVVGRESHSPDHSGERDVHALWYNDLDPYGASRRVQSLAVDDNVARPDAPVLEIVRDVLVTPRIEREPEVHVAGLPPDRQLALDFEGPMVEREPNAVEELFRTPLERDVNRLAW